MASTSGQCANCGKATGHRCVRCIEGVGPDSLSAGKTYYCGQECQIADFTLVQDVFFAFREIRLDIEITDIQKANGVVQISVDRSQGQANKVIYQFPDHLTMSSADKKAVLSWRAGGIDSVAPFSKLIEKILQGITSASKPLGESTYRIINAYGPPIEEAFSMYASRRIVTEVNGGPPETLPDHWVTCASLKSGTRYVIDLAGAQYGQFQAIVPFKHYMQHGQDGFTFADGPIGHLRERMEEEYREAKSNGCDITAFMVQRAMMNEVDKAVDGFETKCGTTLAEMLKLKHDKFVPKREEIMDLVVAKMREVVEQYEADPAKFARDHCQQ